MKHCPHRPPCTACPRFGEQGIARAPQEALDQLAQAHGLPRVRAASGATRGFRVRARLAIRGRLGAPKLGLFEADSHRVVTIPNCSVQHPLINEVAAVVRRCLVDARIGSYSDTAHQGLARYLQVVVERGSQTAQVVLVANSPEAGPLAACLDLVRERLGERLHSLWFNAQCEATNTILGPRFEPWHGPPAVVERFGGAAVHYPPGAFGQSNLDVAQDIVAHVRERIPAGARVAEFYAGVGAIGLSVLERTGALLVNEVSPHSLRGLELGLQQLDALERAKISVVPGPAGQAAQAAAGHPVVIADPPRKGLDPELTVWLAARPPERFIYVSCGLASLLADATQLTTGGRLKLTELSAFNLMPFTEHVETVAVFERA